MRLLNLLLCLSVLFSAALLPVSCTAQEGGFRDFELNVVDDAGKPLKQATINVTAGEIDFPLTVDDEGIATLNLPSDANYVTLKTSCPGHIPLEVRWQRSNVPKNFTFEMSKGEPIGGVVQDSQGKPIAGVKVEGLLVSPRVASEGEVRPLIGGELDITDATGKWRADIATPEPLELRLKLSHEKYFSDASYGKRRVSDADLRSLDHVETLADRLPPQGTISDTEGHPVANVALFVIKHGDKLTLENGKPAKDSTGATGTSDEAGAYALADPESDFLLLCLADEGWGIVLGKRFSKNEPVEIVLTPWASVAGVLTQDDKPAADEDLQLLVVENRLTRGRHQVVWNNHCQTNEKGEFVFERLVNGHAVMGGKVEYCGAVEQQREKFSNEAQTSLQPGQTAKIQINRQGPAASGTVVPLLYDGSEAAIACGMIELVKEHEPTDMLKGLFYDWGKAASAGVQFDPARNAALLEDPPQPSYVAQVAADGTFHFSSLPPGKYRAKVSLWAEATDDEEARWLGGSIWEAIPVTNSDDAKEQKVNLGLLEFEVYESDEE